MIRQFVRLTTGLLIAVLVAVALPGLALAAQQAVVKGSSVNIRSGPGTTYQVAGSAVKGDRLDVLGKSNDWYQVKKAGGATGWIAAYLVEVSGNTAPVQAKSTTGTSTTVATAVVTGSYLNLRSGPGTGYQASGQLKQGTSLQIVEKSGDWYKVKTPAGSVGWVASWLVAVKNTPVATTAPVQSQAPASSAPGNVQKAVVKGTVVNIRGGAGTGFQVLGQLKMGTTLTVLGKSGDWYKLQTPVGPGWVLGSLLTISSVPANTASPQTPSAPAVTTPVVNDKSALAVINGSVVNIRSGPGTNYDVVSRASKGDRLPLVDKSADWYKVKLPGGYYGWVVAWLAEVDEADQPDSGNQNSQPGTSAPGSLDGALIPPPDNGNVNSNDDNSDSNDGDSTAENDGSQPGGGGILPGNGEGTQQPDETEAPGKDNELQSLLIKESGKTTRVTVESRVPISNVSVFTLSGPERLVVDMTDVRPGTLAESVSAGTTLVDQVRVGLYNQNPDTVRLVLDLNGTCYNNYSLSTDKKTLTLELIPPGPGRPLAGSTIVLDPGHGGSDPGAIGASGLQEKAVTLDIAKRTAEYLRQKGANVILTREDDTFVDLYPRPEVANNAGAQVFVSIHINSSVSREPGGTSTYYIRPANAPGGSQRLITEGASLAGKIQKTLAGGLGLRNIGVLNANYAVLRASLVPAALVEVAFISNANEENMLKTDEFREKTARLIADGIAAYFEE